MSSDSSDVFCYFFQWYITNGNHMNDDVAEVNGSAPPMLPGSFLHKKEPGYEATIA